MFPESMMSLPRFSTSETGSSSVPSAGANSTSIWWLRTPMTTSLPSIAVSFSAMAAAAGTVKPSPISATPASPAATLAWMKFIGGLPIKWATNRFAGLW